MKIIMDELRLYAHTNNLKESWTAYHKWGKGKKIVLRFSKSGIPQVEKAYSTHFVDEARAKKIKDSVSEAESSNCNS